jgi:phosphoglycolate phosphatase
VLFDLDGTLLDTGRDMAEALNRLLDERGLERLPYTTLRPLVSHGSQALIGLAFSVRPEDPPFETLRSRFLELYAANLADQTRFFDGMEGLLTEIESLAIPWGVVNNKPGWLTGPLMKALGLATRAAVVVSGDTTPRPKPHPDPLFYACRAVGVDPRHCTYVGDAARDIEAGLRAGMLTVAAAFGYLGKDDDPYSWGAHATVDHPSEIRQYLHREPA